MNNIGPSIDPLGPPLTGLCGPDSNPLNPAVQPVFNPANLV